MLNGAFGNTLSEQCGGFNSTWQFKHGLCHNKCCYSNLILRVRLNNLHGHKFLTVGTIAPTESSPTTLSRNHIKS